MTLRLLPILILAAVLTLSVRVRDVWEVASVLETGPASAVAQENASAGADQPDFVPWDVVPAAADSGDAGEGEAEFSGLPRDPYEMTDEEIDLLQKLSARRKEINRRYGDLKSREALLAVAEQRIDQKISELEILRKSIEDLMLLQDEQEEAQIRSLVKIYENMKPKDAAQIFEELDMWVLLEVIDRMKERKSAPILAKLTPGRAKTITIELAQRRDLSIGEGQETSVDR
jgi:flagellar motility protein MotE (MotC chaperone)